MAGWAIGYGGGSLLVPVMFAGINEKTFYVFGSAMFAYISLVYCFLPKTSGRSLESIDFLFASKSAFVWKEEEEHRRRLEELHLRLAAGERMGEKEKGVAVFRENRQDSAETSV